MRLLMYRRVMLGFFCCMSVLAIIYGYGTPDMGEWVKNSTILLVMGGVFGVCCGIYTMDFDRSVRYSEIPFRFRYIAWDVLFLFVPCFCAYAIPMYYGHTFDESLWSYFSSFGVTASGFYAMLALHES